jgi:hypothetical protein
MLARHAHWSAALAIWLRGPRRHLPTLVRAFRASSDSDCRWLALGSVLAEHRPSGFAAALLPQLRIVHEVRVVDGVEHFRGPGGSVPRCLRSQIVTGYPPIPYYRFRRSVSSVDELLLTIHGPRTVHLCRWVEHRPDYSGWDDRSDFHDLDSGVVRRTWLGELEPTASLLPLRFATDVVWSGRRHLGRSVSRAERPVVAAWWRVVRRLERAGHLDSAEVPRLLPRIERHVYDLRKRKTPPLPSLPDPVVLPPGPGPRRRGGPFV